MKANFARFTFSAFIVICFLSSPVLLAQSPWNTSGNAPNTNCFIGTTNPSPLVIKTNGTARLTVNALGGVNIAGLAATDTAALIVLRDGSLARSSDPGNGGNCATLIWDGDGNAAGPDCFIGTTNPQPLRIHTKGIERMRVTADGNVIIAGFGARAPFQVFDHMGVTINRHDVSSTDVVRSLGFNLYQDGNTQYHYQQGPSAKLEYSAVDGMLLMSVAPPQAPNVQAVFPAGIQLDQAGRVGIGAHPDIADELAVGGVVKVHQVGNAANYLRLGNNGSSAFVETGAPAMKLRAELGIVTVEQSTNASHYLRLGNNAGSAFVETGATIMSLRALSGTVSVEQGGDAAHYLRLGNNAGSAFVQTGASIISLKSLNGTVSVEQNGNPANFLRLGNNAGSAFVQTAAPAISLKTLNGTVNVEQDGNAANYLRLGHNGSNAYLETGGTGNSKLSVNMQSGKTAEFGGDVLIANHVGVGTTNFWEGNREYKLAVNGHIRCKAAHIYPAWADYVFDSGYALMSLEEVSSFIRANGHLPGMPSAASVEVEGVDVGEIQAKTLAKVEELTLYMIEMQRENEQLRREVEALKARVER